jgi:hypothetical protein
MREKVATQDLVVLVNRKGLALAEVEQITGMTRQGIWKRLRRSGELVKRRAPGGAVCKVIQLPCAFCGAMSTKYRKRLLQAAQMKSFCNMECYAASLAQHPYEEWRHGSRLARAIVAQHYALQPDQIVHHKDGNQRNNDLSNLMVFKSNADHVAHHRGRRIIALFDGETVRP